MAARLTKLPFLFAALLSVGLLEPSPALSSAPGSGSSFEYPDRGRRVLPEEPHGHDCPICRLARRLELAVVPLVRPRVYRCAPEPIPLQAAYPRGRIRPEALATLRFDVQEEFFDVLEVDPKNASTFDVAFRMGAAEVARMAVPLPEDFVHRIGVPEDLRARLLGLRGRITWGCFDIRDRQAVGAFWLDAPTSRERQRLHDVDRAVAHQEGWVRHVILGYAELEADFDMAALAHAKKALARRPDEPHAAALAWYVYGLLELSGLEEGRTLMARLRDLIPKHERSHDPSCRLHDQDEWPRRRRPRFATCGG